MKQGDDFKVLKPPRQHQTFLLFRFDTQIVSQIRGCSSQAADWDLMLIKRATARVARLVKVSHGGVIDVLLRAPRQPSCKEVAIQLDEPHFDWGATT